VTLAATLQFFCPGVFLDLPESPSGEDNRHEWAERSRKACPSLHALHLPSCPPAGGI